MINKDIELDKVFFNVAFNIKEKAFVLSLETESDDEEYAKLLSEWNNYGRPIQADQLQSPYEKPLALAVFNLDGETLCKKLGSMSPYYGMMLGQLNAFCNAGMMLETIDGNVTVAIDDITEGSPKFYVSARVKNKDFMKGAENWEEGLAALDMQCQQIEGDNYLLKNDEDKVFFGVRDDLFYLASDYEVAKDGGKFSSLKDGSPLKSLAKGKLSYFSLDIDKLIKSPLLKSSQVIKDESAKKVFGYLDRLNVSTNENKNAEIELTTRQKISDLVKMSVKE